MEIGVRQSVMMDNEAAANDNAREQEIGFLTVRGLKAPDPEVNSRPSTRRGSWMKPMDAKMCLVPLVLY